MPGQRAGSPVAVLYIYARVEYNAESKKTGQEKVQFYCEEDLLFLSSYYLSMGDRDNTLMIIYEDTVSGPVGSILFCQVRIHVKKNMDTLILSNFRQNQLRKKVYFYQFIFKFRLIQVFLSTLYK